MRNPLVDGSMKAVEQWHLQLARRAPTGPEDDERDFAFQVAEPQAVTVEVFQREVFERSSLGLSGVGRDACRYERRNSDSY